MIMFLCVRVEGRKDDLPYFVLKDKLPITIKTFIILDLKMQLNCCCTI